MAVCVCARVRAPCEPCAGARRFVTRYFLTVQYLQQGDLRGGGGRGAHGDGGRPFRRDAEGCGHLRGQDRSGPVMIGQDHQDRPGSVGIGQCSVRTCLGQS